MRVLSRLGGVQGGKERGGTAVPNLWTDPVITINSPLETVTGIDTEPVSESPQSTGRTGGKGWGTSVSNLWTNHAIRSSTPQEISNGIETESVSESPQSTGWVPGGSGRTL